MKAGEFLAPRRTPAQAVAAEGKGGAGMTELSLRILATSDLHANLMPWDYSRDRPSSTAGLALTAGLIAQARAEVSDSLLFDNGDFLQGSALGDFYGLEQGLGPDDTHPVIAAMNLLEYDAVTLGNHEFSHGLDFLMRAMERADFPVVSANVDLVSPVGTSLFSRHVMIEHVLTGPSGTRHPLRIGVFGLCPPQVMDWESERLRGHINVHSMVEAGRLTAAALRRQGADVIVALTHSGIAAPGAGDEAENAALLLAASADIDVLIAGHTHQVFPGPRFEGIPGVDARAGTLAGKPAVMPGFFGSHLGVIDLTLREVGGRLRVADHSVTLRPVSGRAADGARVATTLPDPRVMDLCGAAHRSAILWTQREVGASPVDLCSHFAQVADTPLARLVAKAKIDHLIANLGHDGATDLPVLAAVATFKAGGRGGADNYVDIPAGPLSIRHVADIYPHPNTVVGLHVTGAELIEWLERSAGQFQTVIPGAHDQPLIDEAFPSFNFDTIHGLTWTIDLSRPALFDANGARRPDGTGRIQAVAFQGRPLAPDDEFLLATNSYRAGGGGGFPATGGAARIALADGKPIRTLLAEFLARSGSQEKAADFAPDWRFASMPGTSVLFDTAPAARTDDAGLAQFRAEDLGLQADTGFRRFRLWL